MLSTSVCNYIRNPDVKLSAVRFLHNGAVIDETVEFLIIEVAVLFKLSKGFLLCSQSDLYVFSLDEENKIGDFLFCTDFSIKKAKKTFST